MNEKEDFLITILNQMSIYLMSKLDASDFNGGCGLPSEGERKARKLIDDMLNDMYETNSDILLGEARKNTLKRLIIFMLQADGAISEDSQKLLKELDLKLQHDSHEKMREYKKLIAKLKY